MNYSICESLALTPKMCKDDDKILSGNSNGKKKKKFSILKAFNLHPCRSELTNARQ